MTKWHQAGNQTCLIYSISVKTMKLKR